MIEKKGRKLMEDRFHVPLSALDKAVWVRPVEEWKPKGKSGHALFRSLAKHLCVKYTMPDFMYSVFFEEDDLVRKVGVRLFVHLGQGGSFYKLVKDERFPVPLTKRMCHVFMQSTVKFRFIEAVRHAQVVVHGGDRHITQSIMTTGQLGRRFNVNRGFIRGGIHQEVFWDTVIQWTCNQGMLAPAQFSPIYDWIRHQYAQTQDFSMKGRTGVSVLRAVDEWHGELAKERAIKGHTYEPSGFDAWKMHRKVKHPYVPGAFHEEAHTITEVLASKALAEEGRKLHHCVYSYSWSIKRGNVSIWSYRIDGTRVLTIELRNREKRIVQVRGARNRKATQSEMSFVKRWAQENGLKIAGWV